jgi:hypothetical protein
MWETQHLAHSSCVRYWWPVLKLVERIYFCSRQYMIATNCMEPTLSREADGRSAIEIISVSYRAKGLPSCSHEPHSGLFPQSDESSSHRYILILSSHLRSPFQSGLFSSESSGMYCPVLNWMSTFTAVLPRRFWASYSPPWEPEISHGLSRVCDQNFEAKRPQTFEHNINLRRMRFLLSCLWNSPVDRWFVAFRRHYTRETVSAEGDSWKEKGHLKYASELKYACLLLN